MPSSGQHTDMMTSCGKHTDMMASCRKHTLQTISVRCEQYKLTSPSASASDLCEDVQLAHDVLQHVRQLHRDALRLQWLRGRPAVGRRGTRVEVANGARARRQLEAVQPGRAVCLQRYAACKKRALYAAPPFRAALRGTRGRFYDTSIA